MGKNRPRYTDEELSEIAKCYNTRSELRKNEKSAYLLMSRRGLLDKFCAHMERWFHTEDELASIAKDYDDLTLFRKEQKAAYTAMQRRGWIDKLCGHMKRNMRPDYTDEELRAIASGYNNLTLFKKEQRYAYFAIHRHGKFDEMCSHMKRNMRKAYTEEEIRDIALKFKTRSEFQQEAGAVYQAASRRDILDDVCSHMEKQRRPKWFHSKGYCRIIALGYKTRDDFRKGAPSVYQRAHMKGWLDDICGHMEVENNWDKRLVYVYTFSDGYAYVGLTDDIKRRKNEHLHKYAHKKLSPVLRHCRETGASYEYKELTDWLDAATAAKMEDDYIKKYKADGWEMLNRMRGGGLGGNIRKEHVDKTIRTIVRRYDYVEDFRESEPDIYEELCSSKRFGKYCSELKLRKKPRGYWTLEKAVSVIHECETRDIFQKRYCQAYRIVKAAGLLPEYYPERPKPKCKWTLKNCADAARYCKTKAEFRKKYHRAYERLRKEDLLDELLEDTDRREHQRTYTDEERIEILKVCESRTELRSKYAGVYKWARMNGVIDKYMPKK